MKITMSPDELMEFTMNGKFPESSKKSLVGGIIAMCNSPEMTEAIMAKVNSEIRSVMANAVSIQAERYGSNNKSLRGWASEIILTELTNKAKEIDLKEVIKTAVAEEVKNHYDTALRQNIRTIILEEYNGLMEKRMIDHDLGPVIEAKVKKSLAGILAK